MAQYAVSVQGIGLCSALGGHQDSCAAHRAGLSGFAAHEFMQEAAKGDEDASAIQFAPAANVSGYQALARAAKMFCIAWQDLAIDIGEHRRTTLLFALPEPETRNFGPESSHDSPVEQQREDFADKFSKVVCTLLPQWKQFGRQFVFGDRLAFARIVEKAGKLLAGGEADHCLLCVFDSLTDDAVLDRLWGQNQLKTPNNPLGYIPGEGAAVIALSGHGAAKRGYSLGINVSLDRSSFEPHDPEIDEGQISEEERESWQGKKLFQLLEPMLRHKNEVSSGVIQLVLDINGQEKRSAEFGMIQVALKRVYPSALLLDPVVPALSFGETGTMTGAYGLAAILASVQRRYAKTLRFVMLLSENNGRRAVVEITFLS